MRAYGCSSWRRNCLYFTESKTKISLDMLTITFLFCWWSWAYPWQCDISHFSLAEVKVIGGTYMHNTYMHGTYSCVSCLPPHLLHNFLETIHAQRVAFPIKWSMELEYIGYMVDWKIEVPPTTYIKPEGARNCLTQSCWSCVSDFWVRCVCEWVR